MIRQSAIPVIVWNLSDEDVTTVIPCLNEAGTLARCIEASCQVYKRLGLNGEVLIADNGSTDGSPEFARAVGARVVHIEPKGYGNAVRGGIAAARSQYIILGDADDSYDFGEIGPFLERLQAGDDLVMGNRFKGNIHPGAMPWLHRYVGNPFLTGLLNLLFGSRIGDAHCGLRAFRKESIEQLNLTSTGMELASEMVVKALLHGYKISEVPVTLRKDGRNRPPHLRTFRDGFRHLWLLLSMRLRLRKVAKTSQPTATAKT